MAKMKKEKLTFEQKVQKDMPEFTGVVDGLSVDQLEKRLSDIAKATEILEQKKEQDEELAKAKANAAELGAVYRDGKSANRVKTRYIVGLIKEKGGKVD